MISNISATIPVETSFLIILAGMEQFKHAFPPFGDFLSDRDAKK